MKKLMFILVSVLITLSSINVFTALGNENQVPEIIQDEENNDEDTPDSAEKSQKPEEGIPSENKTQENENQHDSDNRKEEGQQSPEDYKLEYDDSLVEPWG